jgi:Lipopolysaccharide export system permease LptF/LptG
MNTPGDRLRSFAARWCAPDTMSRVIDPLITDLRFEHGEAARAGRRWKARLVRVAGWIAFMKVVALCLYRDGLSRGAPTTDDRRMLGRVFAWSGGITIIVIALLELPFVSAYASPLNELTPMRFVYLIPQGISLALPIGATLGIVLGLGSCEISTRVRAICLLSAVLASTAVFVNLGWVTPAANQAFRVLVNGGAVAPGIAELPLGQLVREIERFNHDPEFAQFGSLLALVFAFHSRIALSVSPLLFVFFALSTLSAGNVGRWMAVGAVCAGFFSYYMFMLAARGQVFAGTVPAYAAAWFPNVMLLLVTTVVAIATRRRSRGPRPAVS